MNRNSLFACLVVALTIILSSSLVSAQQPRVIPPNNDLASARSILIGKNYFAPDIGAATNEVGELVASCRGGSVIPNSVWYTFTLPQKTAISLSTFGSALIHPEYDSVDTVLAVYEFVAPATYTERACADDPSEMPAAQLVFEAEPGATYFIAAGTGNDADFVAPSFLKLTTRVLYTNTWPLNSSFEDPIGVTGWKVKDGDNDDILCLDPTYLPLSGDCAFQFLGTPALATKLVQTVPFPPEFLPRKNAVVGARFYIQILDTLALEDTKVKLTVSYTDGTPPTVRTLDLDGLASQPNYQVMQMYLFLQSAKVDTIRFKVKFGADSGTLMLEAVSFDYHADASTRAGVLPLPAAPQ